MECNGLLGNLEKIVGFFWLVSVFFFFFFLGIVGFLISRPDFAVLSVLKSFRTDGLARYYRNLYLNKFLSLQRMGWSKLCLYSAPARRQALSREVSK